MKTTQARDAFWPALSALICLALGALLVDLGSTASEAGRFAGSLKWRVGGVGGALLLLFALVGHALTWTRAWGRVTPLLTTCLNRLNRFGAINLIIPAALYAMILWLVFLPPLFLFDDPLLFGGLWARLGLIFLAGICATPFLRAAFPALGPAEAVALGILAGGVLYRAALYIPEVSASPFTLGWSEASRYYYGSLFHSKALYGQAFPLPFLHPSRYLLLSIPFNVPGLPIWAHRLWQVLLWLGMTALASGLLARRLGLTTGSRRWVIACWVFLFIFQGPVYYHLLVCIVPVLAWFDIRRFRRSLLVVVAASAWAGISRINWIPMPAFVAVMLYLLESPFALSDSPKDIQPLWRYLRQPLAWAIAGGAAALGANALYITLSGQADPGAFGSSFTSDLLWYRLWPSPTYPPGILPMILLLSVPLWLTLLVMLRRPRLHPLRLVGLIGMTLVMFAGGLVVSTKIGGGSNLHNLDAYLVLLAVWGAYTITGSAAPDHKAGFSPAPWPFLALVLAMPLVALVREGSPFPTRDLTALQAEARQVSAEIERAAGSGKVLFIWQRQMVTFGEVDGLVLVYQYETVDLMEMAMSNNRPYLEEFDRKLAGHEFALIVAETQNDIIRGLQDAFPEENNVWVERVTRPLLHYYQPRATYPLSGTQLLEPKTP
jgi:hypothetical protein